LRAKRRKNSGFVAAEKERKKENKAMMMKSEARKGNFKKRVTREFFFSSFLGF